MEWIVGYGRIAANQADQCKSEVFVMETSMTKSNLCLNLQALLFPIILNSALKFLSPTLISLCDYYVITFLIFLAD